MTAAVQFGLKYHWVENIRQSLRLKIYLSNSSRILSRMLTSTVSSSASSSQRTRCARRCGMMLRLLEGMRLLGDDVMIEK
jgi:hypothetical protein